MRGAPPIVKIRRGSIIPIVVLGLVAVVLFATQRSIVDSGKAVNDVGEPADVPATMSAGKVSSDEGQAAVHSTQLGEQDSAEQGVEYGAKNRAGNGARAVLARLPRTAKADSSHTQLQMDALVSRIRRVAELCGSLCDTARPPVDGPGRFENGSVVGGVVFPKVTAPVQCRALVESKEIDAPQESEHPPREIPPELMDEFTMQGRVAVQNSYLAGKYLGSEKRVLKWTQDLIDDQVASARKRQLPGTYGLKTTNEVQDVLAQVNLAGKRVLVVGSERPWAEACALAAGAKEVVTLEYSTIVSTHPKVSAMVPSEFAEAYSIGQLELFDAVISFSSLEHSGLGRYGDALNPWGDIISVAKMWCVTKPGGLVVVQVPPSTPDKLVMNANRKYGPLRYPYLMANWERVVFEGMYSTSARVYRKADA